MKVYVVVFSNYHPSEVDSLWTTREKAEGKAAELNDKEEASGWHVEEWTVQE